MMCPSVEFLKRVERASGKIPLGVLVKRIRDARLFSGLGWKNVIFPGPWPKEGAAGARKGGCDIPVSRSAGVSVYRFL
jgi:hypothetical protein